MRLSTKFRLAVFAGAALYAAVWMGKFGPGAKHWQNRQTAAASGWAAARARQSESDYVKAHPVVYVSIPVPKSPLLPTAPAIHLMPGTRTRPGIVLRPATGGTASMEMPAAKAGGGR